MRDEISIRKTLVFDVPVARVFDIVTAVESLPTFVGYGPIPGIAKAVHDGPLCEGAELRVHNTDGSSHRERIEVLDRPVRYRLRIFGFDSPFRFLVAHATEQLDFVEHGSGTIVQREFRFKLNSPLLLPLGLPLLHVFFARALDRNYERLREVVSAA